MNELLSRLVLELGMSRSQFAKSIGVDRSQTVKTINGTLPVSRRFYMAIMNADFIDDDFKQEFSLLYNGGEASDNTEVIRSFVAKIREEKAEPSYPLENEIGKVVYSVAKSALERGEEAFAVLSGDMKDVDAALLRALDETGSMKLRRIVPAAAEISVEGVEMLFSAAQFASRGVATFFSAERFGGVFPFAVFGGRCGVLIDDSGNYVKIDDEAVLRALSEKFAVIAAECRWAVTFIRDETDSLADNTSIQYEKGAVYLYNYFAPFGLLDYDILSAAALPGIPADMRDILVRNTISAYNKRAENMKEMFFTSCAVEKFARTGDLITITDRYVTPLSPAHRIVLLQRLGKMIEEGRAHILKVDRMSFIGDIAVKNSALDFGLCGASMRKDLYCAHLYVAGNSVHGTERLCRDIRAFLELPGSSMSIEGANYFLESLVLSLSSGEEGHGGES